MKDERCPVCDDGPDCSNAEAMVACARLIEEVNKQQATDISEEAVQAFTEYLRKCAAYHGMDIETAAIKAMNETFDDMCEPSPIKRHRH
jgi:hypothetical protein